MQPEGLTEAGLLRVIGRVERLLDRFAPEESFDPDIFERYIAFKWEKNGKSGRIVPVEHPNLTDLSTLIGIDIAKEDLVRNTAQFVEGYMANDVLLWGERGTGKSSCVRGLLKLFGAKGLRIVEVQREDLLSLSAIINLLRPVHKRIIIFCDDLSFNESDGSYRDLKALLDGGLEARPQHILVYATSNRRHLMPEKMSDNTGGEIHPEEAVSEKLSLADRFGLQLSFYPFDQEVYLSVVESYAEALKLDIDPEELRKEAIRWALGRGQRSGRAARQFINDLAGRLALEGQTAV